MRVAAFNKWLLGRTIAIKEKAIAGIDVHIIEPTTYFGKINACVDMFEGKIRISRYCFDVMSNQQIATMLYHELGHKTNPTMVEKSRALWLIGTISPFVIDYLFFLSHPTMSLITSLLLCILLIWVIWPTFFWFREFNADLFSVRYTGIENNIESFKIKEKRSIKKLVLSTVLGLIYPTHPPISLRIWVMKRWGKQIENVPLDGIQALRQLLK